MFLAYRYQRQWTNTLGRPPVELFDDLKSYFWHFRFRHSRCVTNVKDIFGLIRTAGDHDYLTISTTKCQK